MEEKEINLPKIPFKVYVVVLIVLLVAGGAGGTYYFYNRYQKTKTLLENPDEASKIEARALAVKVGKLMLLPTDEDPSVVTIIDIEKLKDQAFFTKAQNGDKTLIYNNAKIAILYSPEKNIILNVSPISVNPETKNLKVALYNGTNTSGLTHVAENNLKESHKEFEVVKKANAAKGDYEKSIVIDLTGSNSQITTLLASEINGEVKSLPEGEIPPEGADILIILGANYLNTP